MKRFIALASAIVGLAACDAVESGLTLRGIAPNNGEYDPLTGQIECSFDAEGSIFPLGMIMDVGYTKSWRLPIMFQNGLKGGDYVFGAGDPARQTDNKFPNAVRPLRFEILWECDSQGFSSDLEALIVPAFHPTLPFCLDRRADVNAEFVGFDVVEARGASVEPGEAGLAVVGVVPYQLGVAFDDALRIATLADRCCRVPGSNCDGQNSSDPACGELEDIFATLAPGELSVPSTAANAPSRDLLRFRPFAIFDGNYIQSVDPRYEESAESPFYQLRFRGVLEGVTTIGDSVVSDEIVEGVGLCRNCGSVGAGGKRVVNVNSHTACYGVDL
ncbi:MAG: hypothetical protein HYV07_15735 [Deltaproteobacteria bacterium]|nr:hypothetical protein [Deltaproteobacteria bacterium]